MSTTEESELLFSILRTLSGNPRTFTARAVMDLIRGEGVKVMESDFIRVFTELTQAGLIAVAEVPAIDKPQLFRITRRGVELLKLKEGDSFDKRSVEIGILRKLSRRELTKAEVFGRIRADGHEIDEADFGELFRKLEEGKLVRRVSMKCAEGDTRRFSTTDEGKAQLAKLEYCFKNAGVAKASNAETLRAARIVSDCILIKMRYFGAVGKKAICRLMRGASGFGAREICIMILTLEENGLLAHGKGGYSITPKAREYLNAREMELAKSERKRDMRDAIALALAELSSLQLAAQKMEMALNEKGGKC